MFYWIKFVKYIKLFKIEGTSCYVRYKFYMNIISKRFSSIWKKYDQVFGKNTVTVWRNIAYTYGQFGCFSLELWSVAYQNNSNYCTVKCKKQSYVYYNYNGMAHHQFTLIPIWHDQFLYIHMQNPDFLLQAVTIYRPAVEEKGTNIQTIIYSDEQLLHCTKNEVFY